MKSLAINNQRLLIDDEDYPVLSRFKWRLDSGGYPITHAYSPNTNSIPLLIHYFLIPRSEDIRLRKLRIIHKDGNLLNCQKDNLKLVDYSISQHRSKRRSNSKNNYRGVSKSNVGNHFYARIIYKSNRIYLGTFETEELAAKAWNSKALELFGEYAYQNKIL